MACESNHLLSAFHDGELDAASREAMRRHLAECPQCAAELAEMKSISGLFAQAERPHLSDFARYRMRVNAESLVQADLLRFARAVRAIAACILVGASVWLWMAPGATTSTPEQVAAPPPQVDVAVTATAETQSLDATSPAAAWYLADVGSRSDDSQAGE